jgi:hypothetical protein
MAEAHCVATACQTQRQNLRPSASPSDALMYVLNLLRLLLLQRLRGALDRVC